MHLRSVLQSVAAGAALLALSTTSSPAVTITVGDTDPPTDVGVPDGWDAIAVFTTPLSAPDAINTTGQVTQFEFWADVASAGRSITPLLFASTNGGASFSILGAGTTYVIGSGGTLADAVNSLAFGLAAGSDTFDTTTAGATYYVGYHSTNGDGNPAANGGVIPFADAGGGPNTLWQTETVPAVGQDPATGASATFSSNRTYAYNFDVSFIPEPSGATLILLGAATLLALRRARRA